MAPGMGAMSEAVYRHLAAAGAVNGKPPATPSPSSMTARCAAIPGFVTARTLWADEPLLRGASRLALGSIVERAGAGAAEFAEWFAARPSGDGRRHLGWAALHCSRGPAGRPDHCCGMRAGRVGRRRPRDPAPEERILVEGGSTQSAGQTSPRSPAANDSTSSWATSSWYCTGGDFMK